MVYLLRFFISFIIVCGYFLDVIAADYGTVLQKGVSQVLLDELDANFKPVIKLDEQIVEQYFSQTIKIEKLAKPASTNDLFEPEDQMAVEAAGRLILSNFLKAAKGILDLKLIMHRLRNIEDTLDGKLLDTAYRAYPARFKEISKNILRSLMIFDEKSLIAVQNKCRSDRCIQRIKHISEAMVDFAHYLNNQEKMPFHATEGFNSLVLQQALEQAGEIKIELIRRVFKNIIAKFNSCWKGEISAAQLWHNLLGDEEQYEALQLKRSTLAPNEILAERHWLEEMSEKRLEAFIHEHPLDKIVYPVKHPYAQEIDIYCEEILDYGLIFTKSKMQSFSRCTDSAGNHYNVKISSLGVSAYYSANHIWIKILSRTPISPIGAWTGLTIGAMGAAGLTGHALIGKKTSVALIFQFSGGLGAKASVTRLKISQPK